MITSHRSSMKNMALLLAGMLCFICSSMALAQETLITTTQEYYTSGFPSPANFLFSTGNNVFEEADGTLHVAYVENYELYYLRSTDGGANWSKENVASAHNGDVYSAALTVDHDGSVFIGFTVHDLYNYANPSGNNYGNEWYFKLYCANNRSGSWEEESVYTPTSNFGAKAMAMAVDTDNNIHLFANRYGWYTYGGTAWEWVRDPASDTWGGQSVAATVAESAVDNMFYDYYRPLVDSTGIITMIMGRRYTDDGGASYTHHLFYTQKSGTSWSGIAEIDQPTRSYVSTYQFDAAIDGSDHIYVVYVKDLTAGVPQILLSTDFGAASPIYTGASGDQIWDLKLHSDSAGNLSMIVRRGNSEGAPYPTAMMRRPTGGAWSSFEEITTAPPDDDVYYLSIALTDTGSGSFNTVKGTYFDREVAGGPPYGPDNLYFNKLQVTTLFGPRQIITSTADGIEYAIGTDIDGDGDKDILASLRPTGASRIVWLENTNGAANFGGQNLIGIETYASSFSFIDAADIDGDGDMDVITGSPGDGGIFWYENTDGSGTFAPAVSVATADGAGWRVCVRAEDIDGDGDQDIVSAEYGADRIAWHENTAGDGSLWSTHNITAISGLACDGAWSVYTADIDGDGDMDVISGANWDVNDVAWYENTAGNGLSWTAFPITTSADGTRFVYAADMDGDSDLDVLSASFFDDKVAWYENTDGQGYFGAQKVITTSADGTQLVNAADYDNDGDMDALSATGTYLNWYENMSGDATSLRTHTIAIDEAFFAYSIDLDGDGDIDLLSGRYDQDILGWYENLGSSRPTNSPPSPPTAVSPANGAIFASGPVTLDASPFNDPDQGDTLIGSLWMVRRADSVYGRPDYDESFNFAATSGDLTSHEVTGLAGGMKYIWKVGYVDSGSGITSWSGEYHFKIGVNVSDALPEVIAGTDLADFKMVSFPCWLDDPSALSAFDVPYDTKYYRIGHYEAGLNTGEYVEIDSPGAVINPGEALWVLARNGINVTAYGIPVTSAYDVEVPLHYNTLNGNGWNQIGCPNPKDYYWAEIQVIEYDAEGNILFGPAPLSELDTANEYIDVRIWEWTDGEYASYEPDDNFIVRAYEGYWVRAKKANVRLNFPVSAQYSANRFSGNGNGLAMFFKGGKKWVSDWIVASPMSADVSSDSPPMPMGAFSDSGAGGSSSTGGCFIATAAYGSPLERHVRMLREFRDNCLLTSQAGRVFVELYYRYSPPAAEYIADHEGLRAAVRIGLLPVVGLGYLALYHPVMLAGLLILLAAVTGWILFRRPWRYLLARDRTA